jgi:hypothetical protein
MAQAGPYAAIVFHNLVEVEQFGSVVPLDGPFPFAAELEAYRKVYENISRPMPAISATIAAI